VQVNVEIKTMLGGSPRINITDVLKPADEEEEDDMKHDVGMWHREFNWASAYLSISILTAIFQVDLG